jgi:hypothetical protein
MTINIYAKNNLQTETRTVDPNENATRTLSAFSQVKFEKIVNISILETIFCNLFGNKLSTLLLMVWGMLKAAKLSKILNEKYSQKTSTEKPNIGGKKFGFARQICVRYCECCRTSNTCGLPDERENCYFSKPSKIRTVKNEKFSLETPVSNKGLLF